MDITVAVTVLPHSLTNAHSQYQAVQGCGTLSTCDECAVHARKTFHVDTTVALLGKCSEAQPLLRLLNSTVGGPPTCVAKWEATSDEEHAVSVETHGPV